ncbi:cell division protein SepF [Prochlorococcus sp. MIT 1341]|uniref:cell division protein SepF n=1 Tax=Prochlorococcus sp. MIT 1341 TaxID=3096221 RepID=UPI002A75D3A6|nr:cell division protein SepF [Prochlorococcus sp. MIT 1341]
MSFISRLRSVVAGDDYLDNDFDDLDYEGSDHYDEDQGRPPSFGGELAPLTDPSPFGFSGSKVVGMPGISSATSEVNLMEPRSFDEMPRAIQALRERKTVILNLTMMEPDQAQRAVDFVAGGTFAIDGHQERVGESIFLFAPSCVNVTNSTHDDVSSPTTVTRESETVPTESSAAPPPAWGEAKVASI